MKGIYFHLDFLICNSFSFCCKYALKKKLIKTAIKFLLLSQKSKVSQLRAGEGEEAERTLLAHWRVTLLIKLLLLGWCQRSCIRN